MIRKLNQQMSRYRDREIEQAEAEQSLQSYLGVLSHANAHGLADKMKNTFWL